MQARRRETFISLITMISVFGVMLAVMTLNVVMGVMSGFEETLRDRLLGINAHIAIVRSGEPMREYEKVIDQDDKDTEVVAASPTIYGQVMITAGSRVSGVVVRGVDPDRVNNVINMQRYIRQGKSCRAQDSTSYSSRGSNRPVSRHHFGRTLGQSAWLFPGSPVQVVSPIGSPTAIGMIPKVRRFAVAGLFSTGMSEIDSTLVFMGLSEAQKFFDLDGAVTNVEMRIRHVNESRESGRSDPTASRVSLTLPRTGRGCGPICLQRCNWKRQFIF